MILPVAARPCLAALLLGGAGTLLGGDEAKPAATPDSNKTHVLFMGADLSVQQGKKFYRVEDVDGSEFVIQIKGEKKFIRTRLASNHVKVEHELKLASLSVKLDDMQGGPGYTPGADPRHKFNARSGAQGGAQAAYDWATTRNAEATESFKVSQDPQMKKNYEEIMIAEQRNMDQVGQQLGSDMMSIPNMANALSLELAEGNYDLVDVSFRISSPQVLDDPYMVVLVEFQLRDAKPGETALLIHAKALDPIGPEPKYIRVREGGMPVGFKFLRHQVHIYNRGREVATSESSKRVALTRDDARAYLLIEHLTAHKEGTVPATAVPGSLSPETRAQLSPQQLQRVCYVRVSREGKSLGAFVDEGGSLPLTDSAVNAALGEALFKPAVADGKPMEGIVRVRLADLTL
jgi:hypothetical protein